MDFEKLGLFYLGRTLEADGRPGGTPLLYESADLVTHAVIVGMTGSGKTGLGLSLIEEAAIDNLPVLAIDPKGDLSNLLLTFPHLSADEFAPWVNEDDARAEGLSREQFAQQEAERWKHGLADWGQDGARIARLKQAARVTVYTPGSTAATPLSIVRSFAVPPAAVLEDGELFGDRVATAATSVLTLAGVNAEPMRSREHILISALLGEAWKAGRDLDLASLITQVQSPPMAKVGVLEVESFYPASERFALAMQLNHLLAAPGFDAWMNGPALDIDRLLYDEAGKPRVAIISIAHLDDQARMFFVSLLLNEVLAWMRSQRGTSSLRALLYFDELFGFLPPVANPPSKPPLLRLLKQARAFGVGCALATQNPVDLDYKALANAGTWMLGRLQTERDKARVLEGLESAAAEAGQGLDRAEIDRLLSGLTKRVFLLHNVHASGPVLFHTRWTLSYLRGPMGRAELRALAGATDDADDGQRPGKAADDTDGADGSDTGRRPVTATDATDDTDVGRAAPVVGGAIPAALPGGATLTAAAPVLPPAIPQYFAPAAGGGVWHPTVCGVLRLHYSDKKLGVDERRDVTVSTPVTTDPVPVDWEHATVASFAADDLSTAPPPSGGRFATLPPKAAQPKSYAVWSKDLVRWAAQSQALELHRLGKLKMTSRAEETERDFLVRCQLAAREARDEAVAALRKKYRTKVEGLETKIRRAEQARQREQEQASESKMQAGVSMAATIFGAILGRKAVSASTLGRATTAARGMSRIGRETADVARAESSLATLREQHAALSAEIEEQAQALATEFADVGDADLERVLVKPQRGGIGVQLLALVWQEDGAAR